MIKIQILGRKEIISKNRNPSGRKAEFRLKQKKIMSESTQGLFLPRLVPIDRHWFLRRLKCEKIMMTDDGRPVVAKAHKTLRVR